MVTTDGHRLAYIERAIDDKEAVMDTLIPKKALLELVKISRDDGEVSFGEDQNHIYFETDGRLLITRKLSGQFPNYEMVMPKDNDKSVIFDLDEMRDAVRRMSLIADERNRSIRLTVREGEIEVTAQSSEEGEGNEVVQADYKGEEIQLGFNWQYLLEFLTNAATGDVLEAGSVRVRTGSGSDWVIRRQRGRRRHGPRPEKAAPRYASPSNSKTPTPKPKCPSPAKPPTTTNTSSCR